MSADRGRTRWVLVWQIVLAWFVWTWPQFPVDPEGESGLADPVVVLLVASGAPGLAVAALSARFWHKLTGALSWVVAFGYGIWLGGWASLVAISAGNLYCDPPACRSALGPRVIAFATATLVVLACARAEAALRKRWATAPS